MFEALLLFQEPARANCDLYPQLVRETLEKGFRDTIKARKCSNESVPKSEILTDSGFFGFTTVLLGNIEKESNLMELAFM